MAVSIPDMPSPMTAGLCVPENPIVVAQLETCWPNVGPGVGVAADAADADIKTVPAATAVARRMRTGFMINAFRCREVRRCAGPMWRFLSRRGTFGVFNPVALKYRLD